MTPRAAVSSPPLAIQGGHFTIRDVSMVPGAPDPQLVNRLLAERRHKPNPGKPLSKRRYAQLAMAMDDCRVLIATQSQPEHPLSMKDPAVELWWSEARSEVLDDPSTEIERVVVLRYEQRSRMKEDLHRALLAYRRVANSSRLYVLVGDLALPKEIRRWMPELFLPPDYLEMLQGTDYELLLESKCRNIGKRRLLDKVQKRRKSRPKLNDNWFEASGALLVDDEENQQLLLASTPILDARNGLNAHGPVKLLVNSSNVTCALILAGMLERFRRAGFESCWLYFDRQDDFHIRLKVLDACTTHGIFSRWLGRTNGLSVRLQWSSDGIDRWSSAGFIEPSRLAARRSLLCEVSDVAQSFPVSNAQDRLTTCGCYDVAPPTKAAASGTTTRPI